MNPKASWSYNDFINGLEASWKLTTGPGGMNRVKTTDSIKTRKSPSEDEALSQSSCTIAVFVDCETYLNLGDQLARIEWTRENIVGSYASGVLWFRWMKAKTCRWYMNLINGFEAA
ncbi:hypothetical protein C8R44DRAFT_750774 [Mycena epipterygia]|nr:hypothetical protein C8R44DRAFT_750774 [Mycena epipterygia]